MHPFQAMQIRILLEVARQRIGVAVSALIEVGADMIPTVLDAIHCSQDEHLRFALWEVACIMAEIEGCRNVHTTSTGKDHIWLGSWNGCPWCL